MATRISELEQNDGRGSYADLDDRFLVLDFQAGNEDAAFEEIHRRYSGLARHICQNILRNAEDAQEATQETMLRVFQGLPRFNGRYMVQPWVARIATNVALDTLRARQRRPVVQLPLDHQDEMSVELEDWAPETIVERRFEQARVNEALDTLPSHHRQALVMREFEGRSHEEIAEALDITPKQAKALIHRAKASFRRVWEGERHGMRALIPILLAPFRLPEAVRRLIGSAGEAAASSSGAAAAPAVSTTVVSAGERVAAAAVAIAMATTVSVGAVTTLRDRAAKDAEPVKHRERQKVVVASPPAPAQAAPKIVAAAAEPKPAPTRERDAKQHAKQTDQKDSGTTATDPVVDASATPAPADSSSPSPTATETTAPAPPEAPPWGMQFSMMGKTASLTQNEDASKVSGTAGESIEFSQMANGELGSTNPITVQTRYWGRADGQDGTASLWLWLDTAHGRYGYEGTATLAEIKTPDDGTTAYVFSGTYTLAEWPALDGSRLGKKLAHDGSFQLTLGFWQDQLTLYTVDLSLVSGALSGAVTTAG